MRQKEGGNKEKEREERRSKRDGGNKEREMEETRTESERERQMKRGERGGERRTKQRGLYYKVFMAVIYRSLQ